MRLMRGMTKTTKLLIVDDDEDDVFLISDTLENILEHHIEIDCVSTPSAGLEKLRTSQVDLILCDYKLGATSGIDFIRSIRSEKIDVPVILLTGVGSKEVDQAALEAGAADFLAKDSICAGSLDRAIRYAVANHSRQQLLQAAVDNANAAVVVIDQYGTPILWNQLFRQLISPDDEEISETAIRSFVTNVSASPHEDFRIRDIICDVHVAALPDGGQLFALYDVSERVRAIEERKGAERRIAHLANHDVLTGLPNRSAFHTRLAQEIEIACAHDGEFYLLNLDLDRFKEVNDVYGHKVGDDLLFQVSQRLQAQLQPDEFLARLGGDEFVAIQRKSRGDNGMPSLASRFLQAIGRGITVDDKILNSSISVGAAIFPRHGRDAEVLLSNADAAMYRAKSQLGISFSLFDEEMDERIRKRSLLANDLKNALTEKNLEVFFQPQAGLPNLEITGFEALARWHHPKYGYVAPCEFIPIAEQTGLIIELGEQVMRYACAFINRLPERYSVAINISPVQIKHSDLVSTVRSVVEETGVCPTRLELEITESVFIDDLERTRGMLNALRGMGLSIVMDDFGTGYSSLRALVAFPFDKIKIDRSFVQKIGHCKQSEEIMKAVLDLAQRINFGVIAEGVEQDNHVQFLLNEECPAAQGFLIGTPLGAVAAEKFALMQCLTDTGQTYNHTAATALRFNAPVLA
ncbi:MAG: EAL domain-containing protein [Pseudomonadota bacterium]